MVTTRRGTALTPPPPHRSIGAAKPTSPKSLLHRFRRAEAVAVLWLLVQQLLRPVAQKHWGHAEIGGAPQWRNAIGLPTQFAVIPPIFALAYAANGRSLRRWGERWDRERSGAFEWMFLYIFAAFLLCDFFTHEPVPMMLWHHIGCLLGVRARKPPPACAAAAAAPPPPPTRAHPRDHRRRAQHVVAAFVVPRGFPLYFAGVVALELGSGVCNVFYLEAPPQGAAVTLLYAVGMTASNVGASACARLWCSRDVVEPLSGRVLGFFLTGIIVLLRQKSCHEEVLPLLFGS